VLFYVFDIERHVPANHLIRAIDRFVALSGDREVFRPFFSDMGMPSIDLESMIRMLLVD
jgi:transposase